MTEKMTVKKITFYAMFIALALIVSYIERMIPFNFGFPGIKLGLTNIVVVTVLYLRSAKDAFIINVFRIALSAMLFGSPIAGLYSLAGGMLSFLVMWLAKKSNKLSITGVSVLGGVFHNIGQILVVMLVISNAKMLFYLPALLISGVITGALIGVLGGVLTNKLQKTGVFSIENEGI